MAIPFGMIGATKNGLGHRPVDQRDVPLAWRTFLWLQPPKTSPPPDPPPRDDRCTPSKRPGLGRINIGRPCPVRLDVHSTPRRTAVLFRILCRGRADGIESRLHFPQMGWLASDLKSKPDDADIGADRMSSWGSGMMTASALDQRRVRGANLDPALPGDAGLIRLLLAARRNRE